MKRIPYVQRTGGTLVLFSHQPGSFGTPNQEAPAANHLSSVGCSTLIISFLNRPEESGLRLIKFVMEVTCLLHADFDKKFFAPKSTIVIFLFF
jgi:hypothetical protein